MILKDNASNMRKAMDSMTVRSLGCVAHTMQLVVNEGLLSQRTVSDAVASGRQIVAHFKHFPTSIFTAARYTARDEYATKTPAAGRQNQLE